MAVSAIHWAPRSFCLSEAHRQPLVRGGFSRTAELTVMELEMARVLGAISFTVLSSALCVMSAVTGRVLDLSSIGIIALIEPPAVGD